MRSQVKFGSPEALIASERASRLGLLASLAFASSARLYAKDSPDQPRDDIGRWVETDGDHASEPASRDLVASEAFVGRQARTGDPKVDHVTEILEQQVVEVLNEIGPGVGPLYGIQVHAAFARAVREADIPDVTVEQPWFYGDPVTASVLGSIRTDVTLHSDLDGKPIAAWDLKTGQAVLGPSRAAEIRQHLGAGPDMPVIELHVMRGSTFKTYEIRSMVYVSA